MADQDKFGFSPRMFYGTVVMNDARENGGDEAGGYRVKIPDIHHGMGDNDLPWFRQTTHDQSHQKMGRSPTRLANGSCCMVMYNDSGENPIIMGSVDTSGLSQGGKTVDGSPAINREYNSLPPACHGCDTDWQHYFNGRQQNSGKHDDPGVLLKTPGLDW